MKQIDKYIKRNKHECIWDLGLYILLPVASITLSRIIPFLRVLVLHLFFNIHIIFLGGNGREWWYCFGVCLFLFLLPGQ